jgi:hypothetical protein
MKRSKFARNLAFSGGPHLRENSWKIDLDFDTGLANPIAQTAGTACLPDN